MCESLACHHFTPKSPRFGLKMIIRASSLNIWNEKFTPIFRFWEIPIPPPFFFKLVHTFWNSGLQFSKTYAISLDLENLWKSIFKFFLFCILFRKILNWKNRLPRYFVNQVFYCMFFELWKMLRIEVWISKSVNQFFEKYFFGKIGISRIEK